MATGIDAMIQRAVQRGIEDLLGPYLRRLSQPEPAVLTAAQVAVVLQVSEDTVWRLVKRGVLPRVPYLEGKLLIPREAVNRLVASAVDVAASKGEVSELPRRPERPRRRVADP